MNKLLSRIVAAYRPLYLRGLLLDGRREPVATAAVRPDAAASSRLSPPPAAARVLATAAATVHSPPRAS